MTSPPNNSPTSSAAAGVLEVHLLGCVDFSALIALQDYLTYQISGNQDTGGTLLLAEHPPCISMGREATHHDLVTEAIQKHGLETHWLSRGGGAFVHAPGQLAVYLCLPLDRLQLGLSAFRERFETAACDTFHELRVPAKRRPRDPGIWGRGGHLAFYGGAVRNWVTSFGMYLNIDISPVLLKCTVPNRVQEPATSVQAQRLQPVSMSALRESLIRNIAAQFHYEQTDVCTGHPYLKRTTRRVSLHV